MAFETTRIVVVSLIVLTSIAAMTSTSWAQSEDSQDRDTTDYYFNFEEIEQYAEEVEAYVSEKVDDAHLALSSGVIYAANYADSFFGTERADVENSKTHIRIRVSGLFQDSNDPKGKFRLRGAVQLKNFKRFRNKKWAEGTQLVVGAEEDAGNAETPGGEATLEDDNDAELGIQKFFKQTSKTNISFGVGARVSGPSVFFGPRARFTFKPFSPWILRVTQRLRYDTKREAESRTKLEFERTITDKFLFRTTAEGTYRQDKYDDDGYRYNTRLALFHPIGDRRALAYGGILDFRTKPNHRVSNRALSVRYRQRFWKDWLFLDVEPSVSWPQSNNNDFTPGILFRLETFFGGKLAYRKKVEALPQEPRLRDVTIEQHNYEDPDYYLPWEKVPKTPDQAAPRDEKP